MSALVELNDFVQADNGVFHARENSEPVAYTDGATTEHQLNQILRNATDLSSNSAELQSNVSDWPSEYHLSSTRANLLRALNLEGVSRILELGCGCGSITRYLGEMTGVQVDSVEGSPSRAALAALRCRNQDNVTISTANFNDVQLPEDYYDLVLYVGVTEYAGRFSSDQSDQAALQNLLLMAKTACKASGVTLIAIENRLGLKYMLGANEDHYAEKFIGLDNYPDSTGIRTYSKGEWQQQIEFAGFPAWRFLYPFPDYKIPTLIVTDAAMRGVSDDQAQDSFDRGLDTESQEEFFKALGQFQSRDYISDFVCQNEDKQWQALHQAGTFDQHANSFLILLGDSSERLLSMSDFTFKAFEVSRFDYLDEVSSAIDEDEQSASADAQRIELKNQLSAVSNELQLLKGSKGWRLLNVFRRLLGNKPH